MSKKIVSCGLGLLGIVLFIGFTAFLIKVSVDASREATLKLTLGSEVSALAAYLLEASRGLRRSATSLRNAWNLEGIPCYTAANTPNRGSYLLDTVMSLQQSFVALRYVYISYAIPGGNTWGDCGCQSGPDLGPPFSCYYANQSNYLLFTDNANLSQITKVVPDSDTSMAAYTQVIKTMTKANWDSGLWHTPEQWVDTLTNKTVRVMSFSLPIAFDANGNCILAASSELDLSTPNLGLNGIGALGEMVLLDGRGSGFLIDGSLEHFYTATPTATPSSRINDLITTFKNANNNNILVNASFSQNGFNYQSATIDGVFVIINRVPIQEQALVASSALKSVFDSIMLATGGSVAAYNLWNSWGMDFQAAISDPGRYRSSTWFVTLQSIFSAIFPKISYLYIEYQYTNTLNGSTLWGESGVYFSGNDSLGPQGLPQDFTSYITAANSSEYEFYNANLSMLQPPFPSSNSANDYWTLQIQQLTSADGYGVWTLPWLFDGQQLLSFLVPLGFDVGGNCIKGAGADVDATFVHNFLQQYKAPGATDLVMLDTRGVGKLGGSPVVIATAQTVLTGTAIYTAATLPNTFLSPLLTRAAANAPGGNLTATTAAFSYFDAPSTSVVNVVRVPLVSYWAVVEIVPVQSLQQQITSASQLANSFDTLFTVQQRTGILVFAGFVILVMLIDHLVVMTIKVEGAGGSSKGWDQPMNSAS